MNDGEKLEQMRENLIAMAKHLKSQNEQMSQLVSAMQTLRMLVAALGVVPANREAIDRAFQQIRSGQGPDGIADDEVLAMLARIRTAES